MLTFNENYIKDYLSLTKKRQPDFSNILAVLNKQKPSRNTLFEFFLNSELHLYLAERDALPGDPIGDAQVTVDAFRAAGYDYCTKEASAFRFKTDASNHGQKSRWRMMAS